jgi:hypothetical protein
MGLISLESSHGRSYVNEKNREMLPNVSLFFINDHYSLGVDDSIDRSVGSAVGDWVAIGASVGGFAGASSVGGTSVGRIVTT